MADVFVHVVLMTFHSNVSAEKREAMRTKQEGLGALCGGREAGILYWRSGWNLDQRKNYHLMEFGIFADADAFQRYRIHPAHMAFAQEMGELADWVVGNIDAVLPGFG